MKPSLIRASTAALVLICLGLVGAPVRRQAGLEPPLLGGLDPLRPDAERAAAERTDDGTSDVAGAAAPEWFGVYRGERKVGYARRSRAPIEGGFELRDALDLRVAMLGTPQRIATRLTTRTDLEGALRDFSFEMHTAAIVFRAAGRTDGGLLRVSYGTRGDEHSLEFPLAEPLHLPTTIRPRVLAGSLEPGTRYTVPVLSPTALRRVPLTVTIEGRETWNGLGGPIDAVRLTEDSQGVRTQSLVALDGRVLREEGLLGFRLEREPSALAMAGIAADGPLDLALDARIPVDGHVADPRGSSGLVLTTSGAAASLVPDRGSRQRVRGSRVEIVREAVDETAGPRLGPDGVIAPGAEAPEIAAMKLPSPLIESDDPSITATARQVVAGETDARAAARALVQWVHENLTREPSVTVPSAVEVLASRRGDCNEHAALLTALARAAGLPARPVAGLVLVDDEFYYHAWTEIWLGDWVSADAVFAQLPADATHVTLVDGGAEQQWTLATLVGRLELQVEAASAAETRPADGAGERP